MEFRGLLSFAFPQLYFQPLKGKERKGKEEGGKRKERGQERKKTGGGKEGGGRGKEGQPKENELTRKHHEQKYNNLQEEALGKLKVSRIDWTPEKVLETSLKPI